MPADGRDLPTPDERRRAAEASGDPVLIRRAQWAHWTSLGQRVGYALFGIALVAFFVGLVTGWGSTVSTVIVVCLVVGSAVLAPAIVFAYAVKAADRADREGDW